MGRRHTHSHARLTDIDWRAQQSRLNTVNASFKCLCAVVALVLVLALRSVWAAAFVILSLCLLTVAVGKTPLRVYLRLMLTPVLFVLLSTVALLFDYSPVSGGVLTIPFFAGYLCVTSAAAVSTARLVLNAVAAVSCLYALSLSTPVGEIIAVLRRAHLPEIIIELMYLIYRYIFVLSQTLTQLKTAAGSRMGFEGSFAARIRTTGYIMSSLLQRSFGRASASYDAMEARCYAGTLRFVERQSPLMAGHLLCAALWFCAAAAVAIIEKGVV